MIHFLFQIKQFNFLTRINLQQLKLLNRKYQKSKSEELNIFNFQGGNIVNIFGSEDNYFIEGTKARIKFIGIPIQSEDFNSISLAHQEYQQIQTKQQSTLINLINSVADLINCNIKNLKINNTSATFPLLIKSQQSKINFDNTSVQNCTFVASAINSSQNSIVVFKKTKFIDVNQTNQTIKLRTLDISQDLQPNQQGSSLIIISDGELIVENDSQFENIHCLNNCNGGIFQFLNSNFIIKDTSLTNAKANFGGSIFIFGIKKNNQIENVTIKDGKSKNDGGAIYLHSMSYDEFTLKINGSKLLENESIDGKGGAIMVSSESINSQNQSIILTNSIISGNRAEIGGGLYQTNFSINITNSTRIEKNIGKTFGNNTISYPSHLKWLNLNEQTQNQIVRVEKDMIVIDNFRSGAKLENLIFEFLNFDNEKMIPVTQADFNNYVISVRFDTNAENIKSYAINSETTINYNKTLKTFSFKDLELIGKPLSTATLQFKSDQIKVLNKLTNKYEQNYSFLVKINFRNCTIGEKEIDYNESKQCSICEPGFYSYNVQKTCQECPEGANCKGGSDMVTKEGYWRRTNESSLVIKCTNLLENCVGGLYGNEICYEGHIGALCEECDIYGKYWGSSYSKQAKFQCTRCDQIKYNLWIVASLIIWTLISMTLAIKGSVESVRVKAAILVLQKSLKKRSMVLNNQRVKSQSIIKKLSYINQKKQEKSIQSDEQKPGVFIKMLTNYLQIVGSISTFNLQIPSGNSIQIKYFLNLFQYINKGIFEFPRSIGEPLKQTMNSLDCALKDLDISIPIIYLRLIFSLFIPIMYLILFLIGITINSLVKKEKKFPWYILSTAIMFLIIYVQPDLVSQTIALISCRNVGDTKYILSNVSFECQTDEHIFYILVLIAPLLLIWVFILPIILFVMLLKNKSELDSIEIKLKYGFLYREYTNYAFYWEFVKMTEKIAIILCLNYYSQSIPTKAVLVYIIILVYGILSLIIRPYKEQEVNQVDVNSTNVCAITVLLALFIYNNPYDYYIYISLVLILLINTWFIVKIIHKIVSGYIPMIKEKIASIIQKLSKKISYFQKFVQTKNVKRINPELKKKVQQIFHQFIQMKPKEKKALVMKILEFQISENYSHVFGDEQQNSQESKKDLIESPNKLKNKTNSRQASFMIGKQQTITQNGNSLLDNNEIMLGSIKTEIVSHLFDIRMSQNHKENFQFYSEPTHLLKKNDSPEFQNQIRDESNENIIKKEEDLINFDDSETED